MLVVVPSAFFLPRAARADPFRNLALGRPPKAEAWGAALASALEWQRQLLMSALARAVQIDQSPEPRASLQAQAFRDTQPGSSGQQSQGAFRLLQVHENIKCLL